jgi:predicted small secreted protein
LLLCVGSCLAPQVKRACSISRLKRDFDFDNATDVATCSVNLLVVSFVIASCNPESRENGSSRPGAPDTCNSGADVSLCQYSNRQIFARNGSQSVCSVARSDRPLFFLAMMTFSICTASRLHKVGQLRETNNKAMSKIQIFRPVKHSRSDTGDIRDRHDLGRCHRVSILLAACNVKSGIPKSELLQRSSR